MYQAESERDIRLLQTIETAVVLTTLLTLLLEATVIFRPAVRRLTEERRKLVAAEAHTRLILDNSHDAILLVRNGEVTEANPAANRLWQCRPEAIIVGRKWDNLFAQLTMALMGTLTSRC